MPICVAKHVVGDGWANENYRFVRNRSAQISSDQPRSAQISPDQLGSAKISSDQLRSAQISTDQLRSAQISTDQLRSAQISQDQLRSAQICSDQLGLSIYEECLVALSGHCPFCEECLGGPYGPSSFVMNVSVGPMERAHL